MITTSEAKATYGFRDANESEDVLTMNFLESAEAVVEHSAAKTMEKIAPAIIIFLCVVIGLYISKNGVSMPILALPVFMLLVYVPQIRESIMKKRDSSGLSFDPKTMGSHFLLGHGTCLDKEETSTVRKFYSVKVKLNNGQELDDVLLVRQYYERIKAGQQIVVAMADSPNAKQLIGVLPLLYSIKVVKEPGSVVRPDAKKLHKITPQERKDCAEYFSANRKALIMEQLKNRSIVFLLPAIIMLGISIWASAAIPLDLAIILFASYVIITGLDIMEMKNLIKKIQTSEEAQVLEATVSAKPLLESQEAKNKGKTQAIDFKDRTNKLVHRSRRIEDWRPLNVGDEVYLVYLDKKDPLVCRKSTY